MPSSAEKLEKLRARVRDAFILFEHKEGSRLVDLKDIPTAVRSIGVNPTSAQLMVVLDQLTSLAAESDITTSGVTLENFDLVVTNFLVQQEASLFRDDYHTLIRAFRAFDPEGKGYVEVEALKAVLSSKGEPMTDDEITKMMGVAADEQGRILYEDYCQKLGDDGRQI